MAMKDMMLPAAEVKKAYTNVGMPMEEAKPQYPYGLCLSLDDATIAKLGLDTEGAEVGDFLEVCAMAKITSISKRDTTEGPTQRIELQITHMGIEDEEDEASEEE